MPATDAFPATFDRLRDLLTPFAPSLVVTSHGPDRYSLDAPPSTRYPDGVFFGEVRIGKQYVSFHLMSVYVWPELLEGTSEQFRKRMQGKSCFNFKKPEPELFEELASLTRRGFERYRDTGYVT